ncbi:MAG: Eco57I restriction-modification methylase domain-containing protein [Cyclobacteriaceae bacterium]
MVVFVQGDKWRFSYISKRKVKNKETNTIEDRETAPKRYTYLFGKNEKALTAAIRFDKLIQKQQGNLYQYLTLNDFEEAFSVEKLSKEFFKQYKDTYEDFVQFLTGKRYAKKGNKYVEQIIHEPNIQLISLFNKDEKQARDFCKRMMGRIVFLYFIQKKGWLAVEQAKKWGEGNMSYLYDLFTQSKSQDNFYSSDLVRLFFETLNSPDSENPNNKLRFPYLNGGLFDDTQDKRYNKLQLPKAIFNTLFETFNNFNFTIYEDAPDEHTVAVDPEMLGHIFENLLEDNKDKGAYYTPKEIVHYMCQESLKEYLLGNESLKVGGDKTGTNTITKLIGQNDLSNEEKQFAEKNAYKIIDALEQVKICDPAIGSGAFPMGLLLEIFNTQIYLQELKGFKKVNEAAIKKHIIEESIYGVDIDAGAVDIARLRFWLSLVVDEQEPQPLPNLDFKIVCANTLIPSGYDDFIQLAEKTQTPTLLRMDGEIQKLQTIRDRYFNEGKKEEKESLKQEFLNTRNYILNEFQSLRRTYKLGDFLEKIREWQPFEDTSCSWFDAWWMFGIKNGFDIVIGNPPYVDIKALKPEFVKVLFKLYGTAVNRINLYSIFIEKGHSLLKENGTLAFIIPNSILLNDSYYKIRKLILKDVQQIIKLPDAIFENAIVETVILLLNKNNNSEFIHSIFFKNDEIPSLSNLLFESKNRNEWGQDELFKFNIFKDDEESQLLNSISQSKIDLVNEVEFSLGITPYDKAKGHTTDQIENRVFHSTEKLSDEYVPLLAGKNIQKYNIDFNFEEYLKYGNWLGAPRDVKFFKNPKIVVRQILSGNNLTIIASYTEAEVYFTQIGFSLIAKKDSNKNLKYILAILNSKAINFYHKYKYLDLEKNTFPKILIANCKKFPIPNIKPDKQIPFVNLVDYLLYLNSKKSEQIFPHTTNERIAAHIEDVLNMMVYELYFEDHMKKNGIDVLQFVNPAAINTLKENAEKTDEIKKFYLWLQTPDNQVRQRINIVDIKSPNIISKINLATQ